MDYVGRFAPSPTGLLHFGSLLAAVASYLDARAHDGQWLLRIEDLDPPREHAGARNSFPTTLEAFGLCWDGELTLQSERHGLYQDALQTLLQQGDAYRCSCSRKALLERSGSTLYDGYCRTRKITQEHDAAIRVVSPARAIGFLDLIQGVQHFDLEADGGDFVVLRKDGLFAYQLAVVVDDHLQGITHVVRGCDLLTETPKQIYLQERLGYATPRYAHIPVAANSQGQKLSKQTYAQALDLSNPVPQLIDALDFLNQQPPPELTYASVEELLRWATAHWRMEEIPPLPSQHWPLSRRE